MWCDREHIWMKISEIGHPWGFRSSCPQRYIDQSTNTEIKNLGKIHTMHGQQNGASSWREK